MTKNTASELTVKVEDNQLKITIGIAIMAFAVQSQDAWPEDQEVKDLDVFAKSMVRQLTREEEDGTTPVHRMLDAAANEVLEQGDDGVEDGNVENGLALAKTTMEEDN